jgi:hypothetical protein
LEVVATTSKVKALAAWGSHQDLFKTGLAHETDDPELVKAASAQPDQVLRRPAGTRGELAKLKPAKAEKPKGPSKAALKKVADLEQRLAAAEEAQARAQRALETRRAAVERELAELTAKSEAQQAKLKDQLSAARRALG